MHDQAIREWLERIHAELIADFIGAGSEAKKYPGYSALRAFDLRQVMERELQGLRSFLSCDQVNLERTTRTHRKQAQALTRGIAIEEQLRFLDERVELVLERLEETAETEAFRDLFRGRLESAQRYYRVNTRAIELDRRLGLVSSGES